MSNSNEKHWLDKRDLQTILWKILAVILVLLIVSELFVHHHHDGFMFTFSFHAWFGLLVGIISILFSKIWKSKMKRKDDYYNDK